jgi:hypothetical protein
MTAPTSLSDDPGMRQLQIAGRAAAKVVAFKHEGFTISQLSVEEITAMGYALAAHGLDRPDLLPERTRKETERKGGL